MSVRNSIVPVCVVTVAVSVAAAGPFASRRASSAAVDAAVVPLTSEPDPATRADILRARDAVWRAWFADDSAQLRRLIPQALAAGDGSGDAHRWSDRTATMDQAARFASAGGHLDKLTFGETEIRQMGDVAVVFSRYEADVIGGGIPPHMAGRATEVFVRDNGQWVNPFWHLAATR